VSKTFAYACFKERTVVWRGVLIYFEGAIPLLKIRKILRIRNIVITCALYLQSKCKSMLDKEFKYYIEHQKELVKKYNNKFIVIKGSTILGVYDSDSEAYNETLKNHELGTFLIQHCLPGKESHTITFHSRVVFN
jgi:hypothetical protein